MSTAVRAATKPRPTSLQGLVDSLTSVERATEEATRLSPARLSAQAASRPLNSREMQRAFRLVDSVTRQLDTLRQDLVRASNVEAPQNKVQTTFEELLASGELLESSRFQERLGWTRQALSKAVLAGRMFYLEVAGVRAYPAFYFDQRYNRKDVEAVSKLLGNLSGGSKWLFFTTPKGSLSQTEPHARREAAETRIRTPLQALEDGDLVRVKRAATGYAER